ncbi:ankyrin repeat-containing domain protein [Russula dissimulans]|nr:ankyrin repeat-containing domain protein [Russula dissimulans]
MGLATLAIFYFDFRDSAKKDARSLLSSLLVQLCDQSDNFSKKMLQLPGQGSLFLVVDALDECPNFSEYPTPREQVLVVLQDLIDLHLPHVHFCITSRPEVDIRDVLEPLAVHRVSLHEESGQNQDIVNYINSVVPSDPKMRRWREEDKKLAIETLTEKAGGMFRWVHCQFETLRRCFPPSIRRTLDELPTTLDGTYEQTLRTIDKEKQAYAHRLFQCLVISARPLHVEELAELFAIQPNEESIPTFNVDWRPEKAEESILSACSTLVTCVNVGGDQIVQFSHFSVKEYLTSDRIANSKDVSHFHILQRPAHSLFARACLSVLLQFDDNIDKDKLKNYRMATYAAQHWVNHAQFENISSSIQEGLESLFDRDKPHFSTWIWLYDVDNGFTSTAAHPRSPGIVPLYYAALCGFCDIADSLICAHPEDVNARGGIQVTPLHAALDRGHPDIARLLLEHDPDAKMRWNETPLYAASKYGKLEAAAILLDHGVDVNHASSIRWTPLHIASSCGHHDVVGLLLDRGALVNELEVYGEVPLHLAASSGYLRIVELLLKYGADPQARDRRGETPLQKASRKNHLQVVWFLSKHTKAVL